ncbi:MAG: 16S rRNA (guanine(966)-N(2))-methyltransferase RsmD [Gammaproteobacteria bacterium]
MKKKVRSKKSQEVRINSGSLRGRKITFPDVEGLRPTLGRSRQTLFNWLRPMLRETKCLDLFAGSGALGIEAASNGAEHVAFVEQQRQVGDCLKRSLEKLDLQNQTSLTVGDGITFLRQSSEPFDVIFVDPPFAANELLAQALGLIVERKLLGQWLYLEHDQIQQTSVCALLAALELSVHKSTKAGTTSSLLIGHR